LTLEAVFKEVEKCQIETEQRIR